MAIRNVLWPSEISHGHKRCPMAIRNLLGPADSACRLPWSHLQFELFADRISFLTDDPDQGSARIRFVGMAVHRAVQALRAAPLTEQDE